MSKHGSSLHPEDDSFESHDTTADGGSHFQSLAQTPKGAVRTRTTAVGMVTETGMATGMVMATEEVTVGMEEATAADTAPPAVMAVEVILQHQAEVIVRQPGTLQVQVTSSLQLK